MPAFKYRSEGEHVLCTDSFFLLDYKGDAYLHTSEVSERASERALATSARRDRYCGPTVIPILPLTLYTNPIPYPLPQPSPSAITLTLAPTLALPLALILTTSPFFPRPRRVRTR